MSTLPYSIRLYFLLTGARARSQMQYKFSFALLTLTGMLSTIVDFIEIVIIFGRIPALASWTLPEVALLYGMAYASFAEAEVFSRGFELLSRQIVQGTFDQVLTRPLGAFFQVLASELGVWKLGRVVQGLIVFYVAQRSLGLTWTPDKLVVLVLALVGGGGIFFSIFVIGAASCFWTLQTSEVVNVFTNGGETLASYPLDIFDGAIRRFVTFVVPLGFVSYYPALYLLGRPDLLGLPGWVSLLSPLAALGLAAAAALAWSAGVRHYKSVGH